MASAGEPESAGDASPAAPEEVSATKLVLDATVGHRRQLVAVAIVAFLGALAEAGVLVIIARLAFALADGGDNVDVHLGPLGQRSIAIPALIGLAAGLIVVRVVFQVLQARWIATTFAAVWSATRRRLLSLYVGASWELQSGERDGRLQELVTTYATTAASTVLQLSQAIVAALSLAAFLVTAIFVNLLAAVVVSAAGVIVALLLRPVRDAVRRRSHRAAAANLAFATDVTEFAASLQEMRVFNVEEPVLRQIDARIENTSALDRRSRFLMQLTPVLYQGMALLLVVGAVGVVYAADFGRLASLGGIVLIMVRSLSFGQQLQTNYQGLHAAAPYFETLAEEERRYARAALRRAGDPVEKIGELVFEHVEYEYEPGRPVLHDVSVTLEPGEVVGVIGPSGSGKSTLVQLLLRLRAPTKGRILADGRDVEALALDDWYRRVSFVPQDARLFAGSVADNIRFYREDVDDAAIERAARQANLHDEIVKMADGYATTVGERGGQTVGRPAPAALDRAGAGRVARRHRARRAHQRARREIRVADPRDPPRAR